MSNFLQSLLPTNTNEKPGGLNNEYPEIPGGVDKEYPERPSTNMKEEDAPKKKSSVKKTELEKQIIIEANKIKEPLNAIITPDIKDKPLFKNELAYLSRSDAHHDLGELFKDSMYANTKNLNVKTAFDSALPVPATLTFHEANALASVIISATNASRTINLHTGNNKQEEYLLEALNEIPDCTTEDKGVFSTFEIGVGGETIFKYRAIRFTTKCSNNKNFKGEDLVSKACKSNFGKNFVTNTKLGEEALEAAIIVDFSQHHFIENLASGDSDNFKIHYLMTPEVVNDPAGKPNVNNKSLFGIQNKGVKLISYVQTDPEPLSYTKYNPHEPSTYNNFFSNYDFTLSPIKQIFTKQKAEKLITTLNISYDGGIGKPLTDTIEDSKGENSITTVLGYLKKILTQITGRGGTPIEKFNFNSKIQQKRGGDWFQALSCLTAKNRDFTQILPTRGSPGKLNSQCPVYLVTHDRIAVAFALLNGVNVIYLDYYGRIFVFKNGGDPTLKSSGKSMEEILFQGIKDNWIGYQIFDQVLKTAEIYIRVRDAYVTDQSDKFTTLYNALIQKIQNTDSSHDEIFRTNVTIILKQLFTAAVKLAFIEINLIDIKADYNIVSLPSNQAIFRENYNDTTHKNEVAKFSKSINNIKSIQDRFGIIAPSPKNAVGETDEQKFKTVITAWVDSNSKKLDVYRAANNLLHGREKESDKFDINRFIHIFSIEKTEERKTDQHIFLPFIQLLDNEYKTLIIDIVNRLVNKTSEYYTNVVTKSRTGRTGISSQQAYYNSLANLLYESVLFLKTDFEPDNFFSGNNFSNNAKPLIEGKPNDGAIFTSSDNILIKEDYDDLEVLKDVGKFSGNTENAPDSSDINNTLVEVPANNTLSGGEKYTALSAKPRKESAICDTSVKQVTWPLLTSLLVETTDYCEQIFNFIRSEKTIDANLDIHLDEKGSSDIIEVIQDKIRRNTKIIGNFTPGDVTLAVRSTGTVAVIADVAAWKLGFLSNGTASATGATIVALASVTNYLWEKYVKKGGGDGDEDGDSSPAHTSSINPLLDFNLGYHPLTPIYSMLTSYYNILGPKSQSDPFFYTYFTYINILEKMKRTLEENYLNDVNNKANIMSAYMIGFGLYIMLFASHTSELQNEEILSVTQMSQEEYYDFSLKNDGFASIFSGAIHQTPQEEIVGMVLVNNKLFNNFINNEVNFKQILEQGTSVDNLPNYEVLKDRIFRLMDEIVVKVNADRGTPIIPSDIASGIDDETTNTPSEIKTESTDSTSSISGLTSEEQRRRIQKLSLGQQKYDENVAKGIINPTREPRIVTGKDLFTYSKGDASNMVTSTTSSQGTRSRGGKKRKITKKRRNKIYKNKTIKRPKKHKKTRKYKRH